jgi:hypothetical protein
MIVAYRLKNDNEPRPQSTHPIEFSMSQPYPSRKGIVEKDASAVDITAAVNQ